MDDTAPGSGTDLGKRVTSDAYGNIIADDGNEITTFILTDNGAVKVIVVDPDEWEAHVKRVNTLAGILRDVLLAASQIPPLSMMISAEQIKELKAL